MLWPRFSRQRRKLRPWSRYLTTWTAWNHLRTVAPLLSAILFMAALA
jgi:uncharacterized membrane protein